MDDAATRRGQGVVMETWDAIRARRNVRTFESRPVSDDALDRILEAARRTPSSNNRQAWEFIVITEREQLRELSKVWRYGAHVAESATTIALIAPATGDASADGSIQYDLGQATMSIMLAAADLGIGSCHSAVMDQELARNLLGLPVDQNCEWLISLGYPANRPLRPIERPNRRSLDEVVHRGRW